MPSNQQSISPANSITVNPTKDVDFTVTRAVSFSAAGTLHCLTAEGEDVTIPSGSLAAGVQHALCITKIFTTGTTVTDIILYR